MAPKGKFFSDKNKDSGTVFSSNDKRTTVDQIHSGNSGEYPDTMEYIDSQLQKNSNWKLNK